MHVEALRSGVFLRTLSVILLMCWMSIPSATQSRRAQPFGCEGVYQLISGRIEGPFELDATASPGSQQLLLRIEYKITLLRPPEDLEEGVDALLTETFPYLRRPDGTHAEIPDGVFHHAEIQGPQGRPGYEYGPATSTFRVGTGFQGQDIEGWQLVMPELPGSEPCAFVVGNNTFLGLRDDTDWPLWLIAAVALAVLATLLSRGRLRRSVVDRILSLVRRGVKSERIFTKQQEKFFAQQARRQGWQRLGKGRYRLPSGNEIHINSSIRDSTGRLVANPITGEKSMRPDMLFIDHRSREIVRWEAWSSKTGVARYQHEARDLGYDLGGAIDPKLQNYKTITYFYDTAKREILVNGEVLPPEAVEQALQTLKELGVSF